MKVALCGRSRRGLRRRVVQPSAEVVGQRTCRGRCRSSRFCGGWFGRGNRRFDRRGRRGRRSFAFFDRRSRGNRFCGWESHGGFFDDWGGGDGRRHRLRWRGLRFRQRLANRRTERLAFDRGLQAHPGSILTTAALGDDLHRRPHRFPALRAAPHPPHVEVDSQSRTFHPICPIPTETAFCTLRHPHSAS